MNDRQKEILQSQLNREKRTIEELKRVYAQASRDCEAKIRELSARTDMENLQSIIYQKQYQEVLKKQIDNVLEQLHTNEFTTVQDYLVNCYNDGYLGVMYDLAGQGIPFIIPINQEQVVKALQTDSKISTSLYTRLGEDVRQLKTNIRAQLSRGIANGSSWNDIAVTIADNMKSDYNKAYNSAIRITRTEGHRIQCQSAYDAQVKAKEKGADIVKQWDATLDGKTRPSHRMVDGEIKELDEPFSNGLMKPGDSGAPAEEVVNCRCALLQRARWALDEAELETLKERAEFFELDKTDNFDEFKSKYLNAAQQEAGDAQKNNESPGQEKALEKDSNSSKIENRKRKQLDTGYIGRIPDDQIDEYNAKAYEQIKLDTGYSDEKASEFHNALLEYFGGDYGKILTGETDTSKIIKEGIEKMPSYEGTIYRGMTFTNEDVKAFSNLKKGDIVPPKGIISSWTSNERTAISFGGANDYNRSSVILECADNKTGAGVQHISKFGDREAEVLTSAKYEVISVTTENKYDYLSKHKELLYFPDDLDEESKAMKGNIVCRIIVKEIN